MSYIGINPLKFEADRHYLKLLFSRKDAKSSFFAIEKSFASFAALREELFESGLIASFNSGAFMKLCFQDTSRAGEHGDGQTLTGQGIGSQICGAVFF